MIDNKMSIQEHLNELRSRIIVSIISLLLGAIIIYTQMDVVYNFLTEPLNGYNLHFIGPAEGFITTIEISVVGGIILSWPVLLYQLLAYITPGLKDSEKKLVYSSLPPGIFLFTNGVLFGNQIIFPLVLKFFIFIGQGYLEPMLIGSKYFSFLLLLTLVMGIVFQIPLVLYILSRVGWVHSSKLRATRAYGYIAILLIVGLVVPTPDIFTLLGICSPVIILYEISIWIIYFSEKNKNKEGKKTYA